MYEILKDFAGPGATILASITAAYFIRRQALIAEQQASTALDQLRYNLFERRRAIYEAMKELIVMIINRSEDNSFSMPNIFKYYTIMEEAQFFFPDEICSWLDDLKNDCNKFFRTRNTIHGTPQENYDVIVHLSDRLGEMPTRFRSTLEFRQLTRQPSPPSKWWSAWYRHGKWIFP